MNLDRMMLLLADRYDQVLKSEAQRAGEQGTPKRPVWERQLPEEQSEMRQTEEQITTRVRCDLLTAAQGGDLPVGISGHEGKLLRLWLEQERELHEDLVGSLYQRLLKRTLARTESGSLAVCHLRQAHRATGAYYTTTAVVRYMVRRARHWMPDAATLVDPACGAGAFLSGASSIFPEGILRLVGLDSDPTALRLCQDAVPEADLHRLDALMDPFDGSFDLCLGNPPYISSGLRGSVKQDPAWAARARVRFPATAQYKLNTYPLFVERGLQLLRPGGVLGYILPDSFLTGHYFEGLRRLLLSHALLELSLIRQDFWEHGRVGQSVILFVRKSTESPGHKVWTRLCRTVADLDADAVTDGMAPAEPEPTPDIIQSVTLPDGQRATPTNRQPSTTFDGAAIVSTAELSWGPCVRFRLIGDAKTREMVRVMEMAGISSLNALLRSYSGLIGRRGQSSLLRSENPAAEGPWAPLLRSGKEIDRYQLRWRGEEVCLDPNLIKSGGCLGYYQQPKLLLRQTADRLRAVCDHDGYYCLNNIHLLLPRGAEPSLDSLLAIINSAPVDQYYRAMAMESGRVYAQVDLDLLGLLPMPAIPPALDRELAKLARRRKEAASPEAALIERKIDELVEGAYGLKDLR